MKKIQASQKVLAYSVLGASFLAKNAIAQIKYTDIIPDHAITFDHLHETWLSGMYALDLNSDGKADLKFSIISAGTSEFFDIEYRAFPAYSVKLVHAPAGVFISALPSSFSIRRNLPGNLKWNRHHDLGLYQIDDWGTDVHYGPWLDERGRPNFIGFRIQENGGTYYGWIRCEVTKIHGYTYHDSLIVYDYAINMTPDAPIKTGQIDDNGTMVKDRNSRSSPVENDPASVFTIDQSIQMRLHDEQLLNSLLTIYNLNGQLVHSEKITQLNFSVELPLLPDGVYLLNLNTENKRKTYKIYLKK